MAVTTEANKRQEESTPFDELMKHLADHFGPQLVAYLGGIDGIESCESVGGEVEITHRLTDRLFRVKAKSPESQHSEEFLVHLEFESSYNTRMGRRLGMYGWGLCERENLPVMHLVWYVSEHAPSYWPTGAWQREREETMVVRGKQRASVTWQEVWLPGGYKAHDFIKQAPPYLLPFAALMQGVERPFIKELVDAIMESSAPEEHKQDLLVVAAFFLARMFGMQNVFEEVQMSMLEPNPFVEFFEQRGLQKGMQKGREEGREEAHRHMIHRLLERGMPVQVIADLIGISVADVERLAQKDPA